MDTVFVGLYKPHDYVPDLSAADNLSQLHGRCGFKILCNKAHEIIHQDHCSEHGRKNQQGADKT